MTVFSKARRLAISTYILIVGIANCCAQEKKVIIHLEGDTFHIPRSEIIIEKTNPSYADSLAEAGDFAFNNNRHRLAKRFYLASSELHESQASYESHITYLNYAAYIDYNLLNDQLSYDKLAVKSWSNAKKYLDQHNNVYIDALDQYGTYLYGISDYREALQVFQEVVDLRRQNNHSWIALFNNLKSIGDCYKFIGDSGNAISYYQKSKALVENKDKNFEAMLIHTIARYYEKTNGLDSAIIYSERIIPLIDDLQTVENKAKYLLTSAEISAKQNQIFQAEKYLKKASSIKVENEYYKIYTLETKGKIEARKDNHQNAIRLFQRANTLAEQSGKKNSASFKSKRLIEMYQSAKKQNDIKLCKDICEDGVLANLISADEDKRWSIENVINKTEALYFLSEKARIDYNQYLLKNEKKYLEDSFEKYKYSIDLILNIRQEIFNEKSKNDLMLQSQTIFDGAIQSALTLYNQTKKETYSKAAFKICEQSKALNLLNELTDKFAKSATSISDSLLLREKELILKLNQAKKVLLESVDNETKKIESQKEIENINLNLDQLTHKLEREYPKYYELKYGSLRLNVDSIIQNKINNKNAIIEYFVGIDNIFTFVIDKKSVSAFSTDKKQSILTATDTLGTLISRPNSLKNAEKEYKEFVRCSRYLYDALVLPALRNLDKDISNLTIIPDKELNLIPFEVLSRQAGERQSYSLDNHDYLFEDFSVSYQYSAAHWNKIDSYSQNKFGVEYLGFAPSFNHSTSSYLESCDLQTLPNLKCTEKEIKTIAKYLDGKFFYGADANFSNFDEHIEDAKILHLATHTCTNTQHTALNSIYFSDKTLSILDLNNYNLNTELTVLSACDTGIGEYIAGDGVQSLAWAFMNSGSNSTLLSLWSINDCSTTEFIDYFYQALQQGLAKDDALRQAKLNFLTNAQNFEKHPFYWAPFITYGSMKPIQSNNIRDKSRLLGLLGITIILSGFFLKTRFRKTELKSTCDPDS